MLYDNICALCKEKGISISALEKECSIGNGTIKGWAQNNPRLDLVKKVADYFHVTVDALLSNTL